MLVARLVGQRRIELYHEPFPVLTPNGALLRVQAVGICGSDLHRFRGADFGENNSGLVLGHEFAATVEEVGKEVKGIVPGDRVAVEAADHCGACEWCLSGKTNICPQVRFCGMPGTDGALREKMVWPAHLLHRLPEALDFEDGVLAEVFGIAMHAIDLARLRAGQSAAVLGAGPVGGAVVHLLRRCGAGRILVSEPVADRRAAALRLGADEAVVPEELDERLRSGVRGFDLVFEAAGVPQTFEQAVHAAAPGARVALIGIPEDDRCAFAAGPARRKGLTISFVRRSLNTYGRVLTLMEKGIIEARSMITHCFPLTEVQKAFELADRYADGVLKAVVLPHGAADGRSQPRS